MEGFSVVGQQNADIADTLQLRDIATANIFWLSISVVHIGTTWRIRIKNPCAVEMRPSTLCQITLTTCYYYYYYYYKTK